MQFPLSGHYSRRTWSSVRRSFGSYSKIGFIGLGNMGLPMYHNLVKNLPDAAEISAFDLSEERRELAVNGASGGPNTKLTAASSVAEAADNADLVVTMLFNSDTSKKVYLEDDGVLKHAKSGALLIDSTTIAPQVAKELGEEGAKKGFKMVDAPVSGGVTGAQAQTLAFMCGTNLSKEEFMETVEPLLVKTMGKPGGTFYCGMNGTGSVAKVCNNMALAVQMISVCESLNLGVKLGMDAKLLSDVMNQSSSRCWSGDVYNPCPGVLPNVPSSRDWEEGFKISLMLKDLKLAKENADAVGADVTFGELAMKYNDELASQGFTDKDFGYVYEYIRKNKSM